MLLLYRRWCNSQTRENPLLISLRLWYTEIVMKDCGIYYTIEPKRHEYPEETKELAIKMYYGGVSGRGVGKILGMSKSNVMNWIKKGPSDREN